MSEYNISQDVARQSKFHYLNDNTTARFRQREITRWRRWYKKSLMFRYVHNVI